MPKRKRQSNKSNKQETALKTTIILRQYDRYNVFDAFFSTLKESERRKVTGFADETRRFEKFDAFLNRKGTGEFNLTHEPIEELREFLRSRSTIKRVSIVHCPNLSLKTFHNEISPRTMGTYLLLGERAVHIEDFALGCCRCAINYKKVSTY